jgi:hypothetical protein
VNNFTDKKTEFEAVGRRLRSVISELPNKGSEELQLLSVAIREISKESNRYDKNAFITGSSNHIAHVLEALSEDTSKEEILSRAPVVLIQVAKWMREATLRSGRASDDESKVIGDVFRKLHESKDVEVFGERDQFFYVLPFDVLTTKAHENLGDLSKYEEAMAKKMSKWSEDLNGWDTRVAKHEESLGKVVGRYNFVGLTQAFRDLHKSKSRDWEMNFALCLFLGTMLLAPFVAQTLATLGVIESLKPLSVSKLDDLPKITPILGIELVLLYFFRVSLHSFHSLKAQLLQLDLRMALCAFVEEYLKFAKGQSQSEGDVNRLVKFENLIFSGLTPDPDKVPSTFDGFEQMANMAKELRK